MRRVRARRQLLAAFSILEMMVVAAVAAVMFTMLGSWVMSLGTVPTNDLDSTAAARANTTLSRMLSADLSRTTPCGNTHSRLLDLTGHKLSLYVRSPDGPERTSIFLVTYDASGSRVLRTVQRTDLTASGSCVGSRGYGARVVVSGLVADAGPVFRGVADPEVSDARRGPADPGTCESSVVVDPATDARTVLTHGDTCDTPTVTVRTTVAPRGTDGGRDTLTETFTLDGSGRLL